MEKDKQKTFKRRRRYLLSLTNTASQAVLLSWRAPRWLLVCVMVAIFALSGAFWYAMLRYTALNRLMPVRLATVSRDEYEDLARRLDSLEYQANINRQYLTGISRVLTDTARYVVLPDSGLIAPLTAIADTLSTAGERERLFTATFEANKRNSDNMRRLTGGLWLAFEAPLAKASFTIDNGTAGKSMVATPQGDNNVLASAGGTVLDVYNGEHGRTVVIQHGNSFVTRYGGMTDVAVTPGARVTAHQRIGTSSALHFELWHDGKALDPSAYMYVPVIGRNAYSIPFLPDQEEARRQKEQRDSILRAAKAREKQPVDSIVQ